MDAGTEDTVALTGGTQGGVWANKLWLNIAIRARAAAGMKYKYLILITLLYYFSILTN